MQNLHRRSMLIVLSNERSLVSDIAKMKEAITLCPKYSRFSVHWILHQTGKVVKGPHPDPSKLQEEFRDLIAEEKICSFRVSTIIYQPKNPGLPPPVEKRTKVDPSKLRPFSLKNTILAIILEDLEAAVKAARVYPAIKKKDGVTFVNLKETLPQRLGELAYLADEGKDLKIAINALTKALKTGNISPL